MSKEGQNAIENANSTLVEFSPPIAKSMLFQATSQALSNASHNATKKQQETNITTQAATNNSVSLLHVMGAKAITG